MVKRRKRVEGRREPIKRVTGILKFPTNNMNENYSPVELAIARSTTGWLMIFIL